MAAPYETAHVSELDSIPITETLVWRPVRRRFDVRAFGVNAYTAANAGDEIVENHTEETYRHEELYFVAHGRVTFELDGEEMDAPAGTFVFVRNPEVRRHAVAKEAGSTVVAIGGRPGEAFQVSAWELYMAAVPSARAGDYDAAIAMVEGGLDDHGENGSLLYNLACFEALAGHGDEAIEHLTRAAELEPKASAWADGDSDLDSLRSRSDFPFG
jgi:mannose-6-phosphate isomerase-like protein (cupin superfamily)